MKNHRPHHIGIIPDGNRRWAVAHGMSKEDGYQYGLKPGLMLLQQAKEAGIEEITYYGFTVDNCKRPKKQVSSFQKACVDAVVLRISATAVGLGRFLKSFTMLQIRRMGIMGWDWRSPNRSLENMVLRSQCKVKTAGTFLKHLF